MGARSWLGASACFCAWILAHRFSSGWALPSFLAISLGCLYLWFIVLRVPKLGEELAEAWPDEAELKSQDDVVEAAPEDKVPRVPPGATKAPGAAGVVGAASAEIAAVPMSSAEIAESYAATEDAEPLPADGPHTDEELQLYENPEQDEDDMVDVAKAQELRLEGNEHFKAGRLHDAREAYSEALHLSPAAGDPGSDSSKERAVLHCNRAACLQRLERWEDDCSHAIQLDPSYVKAFARRSVANEELKKWHDAFEDLKKAVELDPNLRSKESRRLAVLEKRAQEQFEKDKDEMLSKLNLVALFSGSHKRYSILGCLSSFSGGCWMCQEGLPHATEAADTSKKHRQPKKQRKQRKRWEREQLVFWAVEVGLLQRRAGAWMSECRSNIVAVHCRGGKGRTGSFCCAWLLYTKEAEDAEDALNFFALRRSVCVDLLKLRPCGGLCEDRHGQEEDVQGAGGGDTLPGKTRWNVDTPSCLAEVEQLLQQQAAFCPATVALPELVEVRLHSLCAQSFFRDSFAEKSEGHLVAVVQDGVSRHVASLPLDQSRGDKAGHMDRLCRLLVTYSLQPPGAKQKQLFGLVVHGNFLEGRRLVIPAGEVDQACKEPTTFDPAGSLVLEYEAVGDQWRLGTFQEPETEVVAGR
eukprot:g29377.t1